MLNDELFILMIGLVMLENLRNLVERISILSQNENKSNIGRLLT